MTTMVAEVYDALLDAGASDVKARKAAEALANYDNRFDQLERRMDTLESKLELSVAMLERKIDAAVAPLKADVAVLRWMCGTSIALSLAILVKLFIH